jgi:hypothetical protein
MCESNIERLWPVEQGTMFVLALGMKCSNKFKDLFEIEDQQEAVDSVKSLEQFQFEFWI